MSDNVYALLQQAWSVSKTSDANMYGVEVAIVTNVKDPEKQGRVKICFPRLPGKPESDWARVAQPAAGGDRGFYWLPEVSDEVLVAFERGQTNRPFVLGALWNGKDKPMKDAYTDDNTKRMIQTKSGHQILFEDKSGEEKISIADKSGKRTLTFDVKAKKFLIEAKEGDVEIHAKKKLVLQCEDLEIKTTKTGKITIGTKFDLKVSDKAGFKAGPKMEIKASMVNLNPPSLDLGTLASAALAAAARAAAAAAGANAAQQQQAAQAGAAAGAALAGGAGAGALVPTTDVVAAAASAAAAAVAGKAGAAAPGGTAWTAAGAGAAGAAGAAGGAGAGGAGGAPGTTAAGAKSAPPGPHDIDVTLQDESGNPASGVAWQITLPDGTVQKGTTADDGRILIKDVKGAGDYKLVLPDVTGKTGKDGGPPAKDDTPPKGGDTKTADDKTPGKEKEEDNKPDPDRQRFSAWARTRELLFASPAGGNPDFDRAAKFFDACAGKMEDLIMLQTLNIQVPKPDPGGPPTGKVVWDSDFYLQDSKAPEIAQRLVGLAKDRGLKLHAGYAVVDAGNEKGRRGTAFRKFMETATPDQIKDHAAQCVELLKLVGFQGLSFDLEINGLSVAAHGPNIELLFKELSAQMGSMILSYAPYPFEKDGNAPSFSIANALPYRLAKLGKNIIVRPQAYRSAGESMAAYQSRIERTVKCALDEVGLAPSQFQIGIDYTGDNVFAAVRGDDMSKVCAFAKTKKIGVCVWRLEGTTAPGKGEYEAWNQALNDGKAVKS